MLIDWFTVVAQLINFLILIFLLKRFLYRPILKAIDARELRIANELDEAKKKQDQAEQEQQQYQQLNDQLLKNKSALLTQAQDEATKEKERLMQEARDTYQTLQDRYRQSLKNEEKQMTDTLKRKVETEVIDTLRKTMKDLADESLEEGITNVFIRKLLMLAKSDVDTLKSAASAQGSEVVIRSTYALTTRKQQELKDAVSQKLENQIPLRFQTEQEEIPGIVLSVGGYKLAWTVGDYLQTLHDQLEQSDPKADSNEHRKSKTNKKQIDVEQIH